MNSNYQKSVEGQDPSHSVKKVFDPGSKGNFKEIRKKFENLSKMSDSKLECNATSTPIPPVRRKKANAINLNFNSSSSHNLKLSTPLSNNLSHEKSNIRPSIKEKSKIFESPVENNKTGQNLGITKDFNSVILYNTKSHNGGNTNCDNISSVNLFTPPAKPPRSFVLHTERTLDKNDEMVRKTSLPITKLCDEIFSNSSESKLINHSSITGNKSEQINSRLNSAPEIFGEHCDKKLLSTPKSMKSSKKTQTIINYFKNISSTANNLCEKVKQKQSNIFVDLTPTTVSPPKHYGTLKRSLSAEHIYAEPAAVCKPDSNKSQNQVAEPLHYMVIPCSCNNPNKVHKYPLGYRTAFHAIYRAEHLFSDQCTPLIPPALPHRDQIRENEVTSRQSVRNMIYGSFAGVRAAPKEQLENTSNVPVTENYEADVSMKAIQDRIIYVKSVRKQVSSSSICLSPKLYEALYIVNILEDQPQITHSFPLKVSEGFKIPLLPHICFPDKALWKSVSVYHSDTFYFSLMDKDETIYGYCLRVQGWPETRYANETLCVKVPFAICILSSFSAPVFYKKLLLEIEKHLTLPRNNCFKYIRSLQKLGVPNAGASLSIPDCSEPNEETNRIIISRPLDSHFVGIEMTRTLQLLDVDILMKCVASLFLERRILLFSASNSKLYHCCKAISSLLYPFDWPHQIVPVLPACLTIHCCSEKPYIMGIVTHNSDSVLELLAEQELLIIDVDKGAIIKSYKDEDTILPRKVQKAVMSALNLAKNMTDPTEMLRDIMISEAFVHMSVEMIGHYENYFTEVNENTIFQKEAFLKNACSHNIRSFLQWFSETQMFNSFIEDSLWRIKYRNICQSNMRTFFEKRVDEYKWEISHDGEKLSRIIGKTVRNFGEMLKGLKKI